MSAALDEAIAASLLELRARSVALARARSAVGSLAAVVPPWDVTGLAAVGGFQLWLSAEAGRVDAGLVALRDIDGRAGPG